MKRICHFSSLHARYDTRIYYKHCISFVRAGFRVNLVVSDGFGGSVNNEVRISDCGPKLGLFGRLVFQNWKVLLHVLRTKSDLHVFHDPELCVQAFILFLMGKTVIYDSHEDIAKQLSTRSTPSFWVALKNNILPRAELLVASKLPLVISATEGVAERFGGVSDRTIVVRNYPVTNELTNDVPWDSRDMQACYIGGLKDTRGIQEIVDACAIAKMPLVLAGVWQPTSYSTAFTGLLEKGEEVRYLGNLDRRGVAELLSNSRIGLLTLHKTPNHMHSLPVKMFEYMAAGMPIICSDIKLWVDIVQKYDCGLHVDPNDVDAIASAITKLVLNKEDAARMGENGQRAIVNDLNWDVEFSSLLKRINSLGVVF